MSFASLFVYAGFHAALSLATSTAGLNGALANAFLYLAYLLMNFFIKSLFLKYSPKVIFIFTSIFFVIYTAVYIHVFSVIELYFSAIFIGAAKPIYLLCQARFIAHCAAYYELEHNLASGSKISYYNGIFATFDAFTAFFTGVRTNR
jgi:hypothetical protein